MYALGRWLGELCDMREEMTRLIHEVWEGFEACVKGYCRISDSCCGVEVRVRLGWRRRVSGRRCTCMLVSHHSIPLLSRQ
jgi:hypothetical protein